MPAKHADGQTYKTSRCIYKDKPETIMALSQATP